MSNKWEDFDVWLDENIILKQLFNYSKASYIKGALIITSKDLEEVTDQRKDQQISIPVKESLRPKTRRENIKIQKDDKLSENSKHLAY